MNKKGAFKEMVDFIIHVFIILGFVIFAGMLSNCLRSSSLDDISAPKNSVQDTQELLVLLKTPITYEGESMSVSDLVTRHYAQEKERGKLKEALQDVIEDFAREHGRPVYKDEYCWVFSVLVDDDDRILSLWDPDCRSSPIRTTCLGPSTIIPLPRGFPDQYLRVQFSNEINRCLNGVQER